MIDDNNNNEYNTSDDDKHFDYSEVSPEGHIHIEVTRPKHLIDEASFDSKLTYEAYHQGKKTVVHDDHEEKKKKKFSPLLLICLAIIVGLFSGVGSRLADYYILGNIPETSIKYIPEYNQSPVSDVKPLDVTAIAEKLEPSVVAIYAETVQDSFFGQTVGNSSGSGVVLDVTTERVYILTNNHVIENSQKLSVTFFGEHMYTADVLGADADTDLAIITVNKSDIKESEFQRIRKVELGDSDKIKVGEDAIAIGNPLGYNNTVTVGVISAVDRMLSADFNALSLIQTDAAINPGNSGGALVNSSGQLIGINTIKISDTAVEGIGFAIPVNAAIPILEELIEKGYVSKPYIGINGKDVSKEAAESYDIPIGIVVTNIVRNSPASNSNLQVYDIITHINDKSVDSLYMLIKVINSYEVGETITLTIQREEDSSFEELLINIKLADKNKQ
jgi:serine protease Do